MSSVRVTGGKIIMRGSRFFMVRENGMTHKLSRKEVLDVIEKTLSETSDEA